MDWFMVIGTAGESGSGLKLYHVQMEPGSTLLDCDAYMVQEHDDPFFQSERKTYNTRRHVYQKLLEEVLKELEQK